MPSANAPGFGDGLYLNYPEAVKGPEVPYEERELSNPAIRGRLLVAASVLVEWFRIIRELAWANAGFGCVRKIRDYLIDEEPWYTPTIVPLPTAEPQADQQDSGDVTFEKKHARLEAPIFYSATDYHALYLSGEITPTDVARALLPLLRRDVDSPSIHANSWLYSKENLVMQAAEASTLRYKEKRPLGILDGVPTGIKDDYDLEGYATNIGSLNEYANGAQHDKHMTDWSVQKLAESGAVIMGKLSMHEFGLDTTGNNPNHGTPFNPFNPKYYPGGSSSGPGSAVGSGLIPVALGSDGGGSVRIPASFCSVFGLKPTHTRVSSYPSPNYSPTCAVQGPLSADMRTLEAVYKAIAQPHPSTQYPPLSLEPKPPVKKLLGFHEKWLERSEPGVKTLFRNMIHKLKTEHGYELVDIDFPFLPEGQMAHAVTVLTDASTLLPDTRNFTAGNKILLALGRTSSANDYLLAQKLRGLFMKHLAYLFKTYPGMMIVTPTTACAGAPIRGGSSELSYGVNDGNYTLQSMAYVWLANFCGLPSLTAPAGYVVPVGQKNAGQVADKSTEGKVPVGLMVTGEWCSEEALIKFGYDAEAAGEELRCKPPTWEDTIERAKMQARLDRIEGGESRD